MKNLLFVAVLFVLMINVSGQNPYLVLTFTAVDDATHEQLDSIKVINHIQGCDTVLYWPDTVLLLGSQVGTQEQNTIDRGLQVFQNYPNPVTSKTTISIYVPEKDNVSVIIIDAMGRVLHKSEQELDKGNHSFRFSPRGGSLFFFSAHWRGNSSSIKILNSTNNSHGASSVQYINNSKSAKQFKASEALQAFTFSFGDTLLYIGYTNNLESGMLDAPDSHETYTFQFATNIPCQGTPTVDYEGQVYNTIQIFSQCWLKENLNVGTMIPVSQEMTDNSILEKYCYDNEPDSCTKYGGLYQWNEMMQYITQQGTQGICPPGWHIPTDGEWKVLEGAVDSQYKIGDPEWDLSAEDRGFDASTNLKTTSGWQEEGNGSDLFGFSCLPGGISHSNGFFALIGNFGYFWTSTEAEELRAWRRNLVGENPWIERFDGSKESGYNVRCLKDD